MTCDLTPVLIGLFFFLHNLSPKLKVFTALVALRERVKTHKPRTLSFFFSLVPIHLSELGLGLAHAWPHHLDRLHTPNIYGTGLLTIFQSVYNRIFVLSRPEPRGSLAQRGPFFILLSFDRCVVLLLHARKKKDSNSVGSFQASAVKVDEQSSIWISHPSRPPSNLLCPTGHA